MPKSKNHMNASLRITTIVAALGVAIAAFAQVPIAKDGRVERIAPPKNGLNQQDSKFILEAAAGNTFEVKTSQLALKQGRSPFVKSFAKMMIADHGASFEELKLAAKRNRRSAPKTLTPKQAAALAKLQGLRGTAFDAVYVKIQKDAHVETALKLQKEIQNGRDSDPKNYAINTLPAVKGHLKMLQTKMVPMGHHR